MKIVAILLMSIFLAANGCEDLKDTAIHYNAHSRGMYLDIEVKDGAVSVVNQRKGTPKTTKLSQDDQKELGALVKAVELETIPDMKSPTEARFYDGAAIASMTITQGDETYESQAFDHGQPPAKLKALVDKLLTFVPAE